MSDSPWPPDPDPDRLPQSPSPWPPLTPLVEPPSPPLESLDPVDPRPLEDEVSPVFIDDELPLLDPPPPDVVSAGALEPPDVLLLDPDVEPPDPDALVCCALPVLDPEPDGSCCRSCWSPMAGHLDWIRAGPARWSLGASPSLRW